MHLKNFFIYLHMCFWTKVIGNGCIYSNMVLKSTFILYLPNNGEVKNKADQSLPLE